NGQTHSLSPADSSAQGVADAINSNYGSQITASVLDLDPDGAHDYRISLLAKNPGNLQPDILVSDGLSDPTSLQQQTATGSDTRASSQTTATWMADTGAPLQYQLTVGGANYTVTSADNSAASVVSAINSQCGDKVTAALVDLGNGSSHDYRV